MNGTHKLFGFDVRTPGVIAGGAEHFGPAAAPFRPRGPDAGPLLTFDKYVSPSVFIHVDRIAASGLAGQGAIIVPKGANAWFDLFFLWDDVMEMVAHYTRTESAGDAAFAYAWVNLSEHGVLAPDDETFEVLTSRATRPPQPAQDWVLLGYDFASPYFISALTGYDHRSSSPSFVQSMLPLINRLGIVSPAADDPTLAWALTATQQEINEDPFFAIAIYALWDQSGRIAEPAAAR
jgi:hypothetical protein